VVFFMMHFFGPQGRAVFFSTGGLA